MSIDELLARELQRQYDAEERHRRDEEAASARLAQRLAAGSHAMSDSEGDEEAERPGQRDGDRGEQRGGTTGTANSSDGRPPAAASGGERPPAQATSVATKRRLSPSATTHSSDSRQAAKRRTLPSSLGGPRPTSSPASGSSRTSAASAVRPRPGAAAEAAPAAAPACPYGASCYRMENPAHMAALSHPGRPAGSQSRQQPRSSGGLAGSRNGNTSSAAPPDSPQAHRKPRPGAKCTIGGRLKEAGHMSIFLTKVRSVQTTWRERMSVGLAELLDPSLGVLRASLQLNFMVDLAWLLDAYSVHGLQDRPLTVLHGTEGIRNPQSPNLTMEKVEMPILYGVHHTKMMMFEYTDGIRVIIHTANLVESDWGDRTQGVWVSPLLPPLAAGAARTDGESPTGFRADLVRYLSHYKLACLTPWIELVRRHDFSALRVFLVASVPGRHVDSELNRWGHLRVAQLMRAHAVRRAWQLVVQCSSIGSLGQSPDDWLLTEFLLSMTGGARGVPTSVIYPTEENVRTSLEGYEAGACLPYRRETSVKQPWLQDHFCQWQSEARGRTRAMPHIKTYTQLSSDGRRLNWFLLTSSNISKAAWGKTEKQDRQLFIRSYELGVLFLPKFLDCETLTALEGDTVSPGSISLPYSVPLSPYGSQDKPWLADTSHPIPDINGAMVKHGRSR